MSAADDQITTCRVRSVHRYGARAGLIENVDGKYVATDLDGCHLGTFWTEPQAIEAIDRSALRMIYGTRGGT